MKKILCLFLAMLMLLSLVACGETVDAPDNETKDEGVVTEQETADQNYVCDLPSDLKYGGETIGVLYANVNNKGDELISEKLGLGVVSDAVYERNLAVSEWLDVKLEFYPEDDASQVANSQTLDIQGGQGDYDLVVNGTYMAIQPAMEGKYINLSVLENINTDKHYWTQGYNDMVTFTDAGMQFLASGPIAISMFRFMYLTLYNKTLLDDNKIPDLYETVKAGDWTLDYQYSIVKDHYVDKDGNAKASDGDFFGFVTGDTISVDPYMVAANIHMITKDADTGDMMYNAEALASLSDLCDKVQLLYNNESTYVYKGATMDDVPYNYIIDHFTENNALMVTTMFLKMETNYDSLAAISYGIAPMPKFDTNQKNYYSYVQDQVSCFGISAVVGDTTRQEMLAAVLEAMAYRSYQLVRPAYYETALSERYMQDPQSKEVLDMIFDTLYFDFSSSCSNVVTACVIRDNLRPLLSGKKNTISSSTKSWQKSVDRALKNYNDTLEEIKP
ncbi:MAG: hypothetical protein IJA91_00270 [Clostridia bacterium]|nr:hypothetical protein [Clostridia bacterium]